MASPAHVAVPGSPAPAPHPPEGVGPAGASAWRLHLVGLAALVALGYVGRATVLESTGLALVWPAGGVAAAWLLFAPARHRSAVLATIGVVVLLVNLTGGASATVSAAFALANVVQPAVFLLVVLRRCPGLWGVAGSRPLAEVRSLAWVTTAAALGSALGVALAQVLLRLASEGPGLELAVVWTGRNFAGLLAVFTLVHLLVHRWLLPPAGGAAARWEWVGVVALTSAVYLPIFWQDSLPLAFVPALMVCWVGLRSDTLVTASHALLGGAVVVGTTLADRGPFSLVADDFDRALLVQLFLTGVLVTGLLLSASREERAAAAHELAVERRRVLEQSELLEAAFESMSDAVSVVAADGAVLRTNLRAREVAVMIGAQIRLGGAAMLDADGQPIPPERTPSRRALAGEDVETDVLLRDLDGALRTYHVHAIPLGRGDGDEPAQALAVFRDVTRERAIVDDLESFAATVAHDLRGPLTGMRGWADLAAQLASDHDRDASSEALLLDAVTRVQQGADRMDGLIGDLLVHVTSRGRALDLEEVDLAELMRGVVADRALGAVVRVGSLPPVRGDAVLLRHLLDNLVGNAVAYARPGVPVHVSVTGERLAGEPHVLVRVSDNGRGVPVDLRERVFERFERVPGTGVEGTGLGLSICRTIAERHGGAISVCDGPGGQGSTFTVRLPAA
jgi:signal transduction histidine kinase